MLVVLRLRIVSCLLLLGLGLGMLGVQVRAQTAPPPEPQAPPPLEGPAIGVEALPAAELPRGGAGFGEDRTRETPRESSPAPEVPSGRSRVYVPTAPPEPITERPSGNRPGLRAQWIAGYWDWDPARSEFVWVGGNWRIPPPGSIWVAGRWIHDAAGWYWVPGSWRRRPERAAVTATRPALRTSGPPADHPDDTPAPAPGPDFFFVPGHYTPSRDRVVWRPGFWARVQPSWDWIPALDPPSGRLGVPRRLLGPRPRHGRHHHQHPPESRGPSWPVRPAAGDHRFGTRARRYRCRNRQPPAAPRRRDRAGFHRRVRGLRPTHRAGRGSGRRRAGHGNAVLRDPPARHVPVRTPRRGRARRSSPIRPTHPGPGPAVIEESPREEFGDRRMEMYPGLSDCRTDWQSVLR